MRTARLLIFIAIIVLLVLAWMNQSEQTAMNNSVTERTLAPLERMSQLIDQVAPALANKIVELQQDIKDHISSIEPGDLDPPRLPNSPENTDEGALPEANSSGLDQVTDEALISQETLIQMGAEVLAKRYGEIINQLQKQASPQQIQSATP